MVHLIGVGTVSLPDLKLHTLQYKPKEGKQTPFMTRM